MTRTVLYGSTIIYLIVGYSLIEYISGLPNGETFKLLNTVGLAYDIVGVLLLSNIVASLNRIMHLFYVAVYALATVFPYAMMVFGFYLSNFEGYPNAERIALVGVYLTFYVTAPFLMLDRVLELINTKYFVNTSKKLTFLGWYYLIAGLGMQFVGNLLDMH